MNHLIASSVALLFAVAACGGADAPDTQSPSSATSMNQPAAEPASAPMADKNIVEIAVGAGQFNTLVAALQAADLVDALNGAGPFTVFAPTDEAFAKLPAGTVESLLKDKAALTKILTYHVVSGDVRAADVMNLSSATTLQGQSLAIDTSNGVRIGNANVTSADIVATNGVIHVIDTVLIPQ